MPPIPTRFPPGDLTSRGARRDGTGVMPVPVPPDRHGPALPSSVFPWTVMPDAAVPEAGPCPPSGRAAPVGTHAAALPAVRLPT